MRAVRCVEGRAKVVEAPPPEGDGVRVRVASIGICGSDLHLLTLGIPSILGHEFAGLLPDGRPVAVEPVTPCGECGPCREGNYQRCVLGVQMMMGIGRDGGMADECIVPESALAPLPAGIGAADGCLLEPLAVAVHGVRRGSIAAGERVAVIGGGTIGQLALVAAQTCGAGVQVAARHDRQREATLRLGGSLLGDDGDFDVVVDAVGTAETLATAIHRCRRGGRVVMLGTYWDWTIEIPAMEVANKEVTLIPAQMYGRVGPSRDIDVAAALLAARPEIVDAIVTHRFPLDAATEAFAVAADRAAGAIKVILEP